MNWVLILIIWSGSGKATTTADFDSQSKCEAAAQYYNSSTFKSVRMYQSAKCFQK